MCDSRVMLVGEGLKPLMWLLLSIVKSKRAFIFSLNAIVQLSKR